MHMHIVISTNVKKNCGFQSSVFCLFLGEGELRAGQVSSGPVSELIPPVLGLGGGPAEIKRTMQGGDGVGAGWLLESLGTTRLSIVR